MRMFGCTELVSGYFLVRTGDGFKTNALFRIKKEKRVPFLLYYIFWSRFCGVESGALSFLLVRNFFPC